MTVFNQEVATLIMMPEHLQIGGPFPEPGGRKPLKPVAPVNKAGIDLIPAVPERARRAGPPALIAAFEAEFEIAPGIGGQRRFRDNPAEPLMGPELGRKQKIGTADLAQA